MSVISHVIVLSMIFIGGAIVFKKYQDSKPKPPVPPGLPAVAPGSCGGAHNRSEYKNCYCSGGNMYCSRDGKSCMMSDCRDGDLDCCDMDSTLTPGTVCTSEEKARCSDMQAAYGTGFECKPNSNCVCACTARSNMAKAYAVNRHGRTVIDPRPRRDRVMMEYEHPPIQTNQHYAGINSINAYRQTPAISISYTDSPDVDTNNDLYYDNMESFEYGPTVDVPIRMNFFTGATFKALTGQTSAESAAEHSMSETDNKLNLVWFGRTKANAIYRNMSPLVT